jgi:hypothetical protein
MVFTTGFEYFNNENSVCFRIMKVNKKSIHFEILHFTDGIDRVEYKRNVKIHSGSKYNWVSFNYEGHRYIFNENEFRTEYDMDRIRADNPVFNNMVLAEYYL